MGRTDKSARIAKAIELGEIKDYSEAARRFEINRTMISRRIKGITQSREEADSLYRQCLTSTQEKGSQYIDAAPGVAISLAPSSRRGAD
jgi:hypothetical protein